MKFTNIILVMVLSAASAFAVTHYAGPVSQTAQVKETAYQRVMRTGTLRCGYFLYPDFLERDVTTKKFSGFAYSIMQEIGVRLNLKIDWAEEVGFANAFEGLKSGRYDAICVPFYMTPGRARASEFTAPLLYAPYYAYVRAEDTRFDNNLGAVNDPSVKVTVLEGEMSQTVKNEDFPKAGLLSLPNMTDISQVLLQVTIGKADVALTEPSTAQAFINKNAGLLKRVAGPPVRMQPAGLSLPVGEEELKSLLNTTIETLHSTGFLERLFIRSEKDKDFYFLPAQPWRRAGE